MKLVDILNDIMLSELAQTARYEGGDLSALSVTDLNRLISQTNRGIVEIFKRFKLKREWLKIICTGFKQDVEFDETVIEVLRVRNKFRQEYVLNRFDVPDNLMLVRPNVLRIPAHFRKYEELFVEVQQTLPKIKPVTAGIDELTDVEIEMPEVYREALIMFVMSRMTAPIGAMAIGQRMYNESLAYYQQFESICNQLVSQGIDVQDYSDETQFCNKGFV